MLLPRILLISLFDSCSCFHLCLSCLWSLRSIWTGSNIQRLSFDFRYSDCARNKERLCQEAISVNRKESLPLFSYRQCIDGMLLREEFFCTLEWLKPTTQKLLDAAQREFQQFFRFQFPSEFKAIWMWRMSVLRRTKHWSSLDQRPIDLLHIWRFTKFNLFLDTRSPDVNRIYLRDSEIYKRFLPYFQKSKILLQCSGIQNWSNFLSLVKFQTKKLNQRSRTLMLLFLCFVVRFY